MKFQRIYDMPTTNIVARLFCIVCLAWMLSFPLFGGSSAGKAWYYQFSSTFFGSKTDLVKGGVPILTLTVPLLLSSMLASLFTTSRRRFPISVASAPAAVSSDYSYGGIRRKIHKAILNYCAKGDPNMRSYAILFILFPSFVFLMSCTYRNLHGQELSQNEAWMHVGNCFGVMALVVSSILLVPVSKRSPLLALIDWSPMEAVVLHMWAGRIFVLGSLIHGLFHMARWSLALDRSLYATIVPPRGCWSHRSDYIPPCIEEDEEDECTCYYYFRNLTGFLAALAMILLLVSSSSFVRRASYRFFYGCHMLLGPLILVLVIVHYNKAVLYLSPCLVYYLASSFPVLTRRAKPVSLACVETIQCEQGVCTSLTIHASPQAIAEYFPGAYAKLSIPSISKVQHPFTVNRAFDRAGCIRLIIRGVGPFTNELSALDPRNMPSMYMHGFHGSQDRLYQMLQHDVCTIVAGGIGITPYLSAIRELHILSSAERLEAESGVHFPSRRIVLHWICRDRHLIDYVCQRYFDILIKQSNTVELVIHYTGGSPQYGSIQLHVDAVDSHDSFDDSLDGDARSSFEQWYAFASKHSVKENFALFSTFSSLALVSMFTIWVLYSRIQEKEARIAKRLYIVALLPLIGLALSYVLNRLCISRRGHSDVVWSSLIADSAVDAEDEDEFPSIEMHPLDEHPNVSVHRDAAIELSSEDMEPGNVTFLRGRPPIEALFDDCYGAENAGLFYCVPMALARLLERQTSVDPGLAGVALYAESFAP